MKAGKSQLNIGTRVRLKNITDAYDADLNGREGRLAKPYRNFPIRDVGVLLDPYEGGPVNPETKELAYVPVTVYLNEFEVIT